MPIDHMFNVRIKRRTIIQPGLLTNDYGVREVGVTLSGVQYVLWVLGVWIRPRTHSFPYNENPTRALKTTSFKCCLPSTDAIDRWKKNSCMRMKIQGCLMQARFTEWNPPGFCKRKKPDTFLTVLLVPVYMKYNYFLLTIIKKLFLFRLVNKINLSKKDKKAQLTHWSALINQFNNYF